MFWGEYAHQLDNKGRLIVPARYRALLTDHAILTRGLDQNLVIYPEETWANVMQQLNQMPITQPGARALRRLLFSGAVQLEPDKQGRTIIPGYLRQYAGLEDNVLLIGMETFIEVWEPSRWRSTLDDVTSVLADTGHLLSLSL
jgi:MraZ protein